MKQCLQILRLTNAVRSAVLCVDSPASWPCPCPCLESIATDVRAIAMHKLDDARALSSDSSTTEEE
jgi:hypothetical protein